MDRNDISHIFQNQQNPPYLNLLDALPDVTFIVDEHGVIVFANAQALPVLGYTPSELVGLSVKWLLPERYREVHANHHKNYFNQPKLRPMGAGLPLSAQRKDGTEFSVEISLSPITTDQGTHVICALRDITERQKIEAAFQGNELFRLFLQHAPSAVAMFDQQMHYLAVSRRWLEDYRLSNDDIIGLSHYDVFPEIPERWKAIHRRCLAGEALQGEEELFLRTDGQQDWVNWKMHPWHTAAGDIGGAILFSEVITERKKIKQALRKSDERFREIFEHAATGIAISEIAGYFDICNPAYCRLLGYSQEELCHMSFSSLIHPDDLEANLAMIVRLLAGEIPFFETENRYLNKGGQTVWVQKFISKLPDETGKPSHLLSLITDITGRKQQAEELLDSHALNASILNSLTAHIAVLDEQGDIVTVNTAWREFAEQNGLTSACCGLLGVNYLDACKKAFLQPDGEEAKAAYHGILAVLAREWEIFELEYPCHSPHQQRWFHMKVSPLEGSQRGVVVRHENVTERKQAKLKLLEKEQMLSESQRLAHIGSWSVDLASGLLNWSDETYNIFGVAKENFGHTMEAFYELIDPDYHETISHWVRDCLAGTTVQELDYRISLPDGSNRFIRASGGLQLNDMKRPVRIAGSVQDITERVHKEQQDQAHLDQLAHVTRLGLMSEMAAGITHEVNQPLSAISSYTQVSLNFIKTKDPDLVKLGEILVKTQQQALRAGEIIARMRDFLKPQAIPNSSADLNTLIQNAVDLCFSGIKEHNIQLILELEDDLPPICADPIQIEQVLINLIRNSTDALQSLPIPLQRQLSIQAQLMPSDSIQVRVKDNGPGIPQDKQQKILTPFYTTKSTGMGMGLSICRSLIEAHAGILHFNSQPDKGTTFYFTLPIKANY